MPDADRLTPASSEDLADALAFALRCSGRKRTHDAGEMMAAKPRGKVSCIVVYVFDLKGNATRAYAWSSPIEGSDKRRFFAVLHMGAIKSPADAVRAAIVAEHRHGQTR
jgi:hypothetical protein